MKQLFFAFPLLKKKRFYVFLAFLLLLCGVSGFLYTEEEAFAPRSFEEERGAIEEALGVAERNLETCAEEDRYRLQQEKAYYESALKFGISPWSSEFAYEGLSLYAALSLECGTEEAREKLETILKNGDARGLYEFCKAGPSLPELDLRRLSTVASPSSGKSAVLYDIFLLEESLDSGKDLYFAKERDLSDSEKSLFEKLLAHKENSLLKGDYNPIPLNRLTLLNTEQFIACLLTVLLLAVAGFPAETTEKTKPWLFALPLAGSVLLCAAALFFTVLHFAPGTAGSEAVAGGGSMPFFLALLLRLSCRVLGSLPLMLLCLYLRIKKGKTKAWKALAFLPLFRLIFSVPLAMTGLSALGNLSLCFFPNLASGTVKNTMPWLGILLWILFLAATLWLLSRKEQKITPEKQELSLENHSEL